MQPYGDFLGGAVAVHDSVALIQDSDAHVPSPEVDSVVFHSDWASGLVGLLLQVSANPKIVHWPSPMGFDLKGGRVFFHQDSGLASPELALRLRRFAEAGGMLVNTVGDSLTSAWGLAAGREGCQTLPTPARASSAFSCALGRGRVVQINGAFYEDLNSNSYAQITDLPARRAFMNDLLASAGVKPSLEIVRGGDRLAAFARRSNKQPGLWITLKSGQEAETSGAVKVRPDLLPAGPRLRVRDLWTGESQVLNRLQALRGLEYRLGPSGSTVLFVEKSEP